MESNIPTNAEVLSHPAFKGKRFTPGKVMVSSQDIEEEGGILKTLKGSFIKSNKFLKPYELKYYKYQLFDIFISSQSFTN